MFKIYKKIKGGIFMALSDYTPVISSLKLPGSNEKYYFKDAYAREMIGTIGNVTKFLGITSTEIEDGATVSNITLADGTVISAADIKDGNIIISKTGLSDYGTELICATVNNTKYWFACGSTKVTGLGELAEYDDISVSISMSKRVETINIFDSRTPNFLAIKTSTSSSDNPTSISIGGQYDKVTSGTVTVNSSAGFEGKLELPIECDSSEQIVKNKAGTPFTLSEANGGVGLITSVPNPVISQNVEVTVPSMSIYGFSASDSSFMTGPESIVKTGNLVSAIAGTSSVVEKIKEYTFAMDSVDTETLVITSASVGVTIAEVLSSTTTLSAGTSNTATAVSVATPGVIASSLITQPTFSIAPTTKSYKVAVEASQYYTVVDRYDPSYEDISYFSASIYTSGPAVTTSAVSITTSSTNITYTSSLSLIYISVSTRDVLTKANIYNQDINVSRIKY